MPTIFLLRHAESEANREGRLAGQLPGIPLSHRGHTQALEIANSLSEISFNAIYSSPLERCLTTIAPLIEQTGKKVRIMEEFMEMDYGAWSGLKIRKLAKDPLWRRIKKSPSKVTFPEGESFLSLYSRVESGLRKVAKAHPKGRVLVVSHGDPIRIALQIALDGKLDQFQRLIVDPASLSVIEWPNRTILGINQRLATSLNSMKRTHSQSNHRGALGGGTDNASNI